MPAVIPQKRLESTPVRSSWGEFSGGQTPPVLFDRFNGRSIDGALEAFHSHARNTGLRPQTTAPAPEHGLTIVPRQTPCPTAKWVSG